MAQQQTTTPSRAPAWPRLGRPPFWLIAALLVAVVATGLPLVLIARTRVINTSRSPIILFHDMARQPRLEAQGYTPLFADGRAMRPPVAGTVARGELAEDDHYERGFSASQDAAGRWQVTWYEDFPPQVKVDEALVQRGRQRYEIFCATCHGIAGYGGGPVDARATELGGWVPARSLHEAEVRQRPVGHLYNTISNGIRTMAPYGPMIPVYDRWAIVAYIRALQLSQHAPVEMVPQDVRPTLR